MSARTSVLVLLTLLCTLATPARAYAPEDFQSPAQAQRYQTLLGELRCLVCQNETLLDSQADLARDLRREVYQMMIAGKTNAQIKTYLVDRYGDFVLYRPPLMPTTVFLWFGPFLLGAGALTFLLVQVRRRRRRSATTLSRGERQRLAVLLGGRGKPPSSS